MNSAVLQDTDFMQFIHKLKAKSGIDLSQYKETQMKRRLTTLKDNKGYRTFDELYQAMMRDDELYDELLDRITINVSEFYRNPSRWNVLERKILPDIMARSSRLKCWSAACSTGDEPFTLVMLLLKWLEPRRFQVLATDIDAGALRKAREGVYHASSVREVPKPDLAKYFTSSGQTFKISEEIKQQVTFRQHNLLADPYEENFDLIICRNVLIYFTEEAKDVIFRKFSRALKPGGYLFIGGTEQIFQPAQYNLLPTDTFFYRKTV